MEEAVRIANEMLVYAILNAFVCWINSGVPSVESQTVAALNFVLAIVFLYQYWRETQEGNG